LRIRPKDVKKLLDAYPSLLYNREYCKKLIYEYSISPDRGQWEYKTWESTPTVSGNVLAIIACFAY
jgi:hypothetical protein